MLRSIDSVLGLAGESCRALVCDALIADIESTGPSLVDRQGLDELAWKA